MKFLDCGTSPIGIYPVVDRAYKLEALYEHGITTTQLRVKDMQGTQLENEIQEAIKISQRYNARFFVNDFWELAINHNSDGIAMFAGVFEDDKVSKSKTEELVRIFTSGSDRA